MWRKLYEKENDNCYVYVNGSFIMWVWRKEKG